MSFIVKGVDLPKGCYECPIAKSYLDCLMERKYVCPIGDTDDCPLIQIPKDHGRIIDESKIFVTTYDDESDGGGYETDAPTILEAEDPKPTDTRPITGKLKYTLDVESGILTRGIEPEDD